MSITVAENNQLGVKTLPDNGTNWIRPSEWPSLTPISTSESKCIGLVAIFPDDKVNLLALTCSTSNATQYTVDWGDGTTEDVNNATAVTHQYTYSSIAGSPLSYGYKVVTVTVTPKNSGVNFTVVNLRQRPTGVGTGVSWRAAWLDLEVGSTALTSLVLGANNNTAYMPLLQRVRWASKSTGYVAPSDFLYYLTGLQEVIIDADMSNITSMNAFFYGCASLKKVPLFDTSNVTSATFAFGLCYNLVSVPAYNWSKLQNATSMFAGSRTLVSVPFYNTANVTNFTSCFADCELLQEVPPIDALRATTMATMFQRSSNLKNIVITNAGNCNSYLSMFNLCETLQSASVTGTRVNANNINMQGMFDSCYGLKNVTLHDTSRVSNMNSMFSTCTSLETAPILDMSNVTTASQLFFACQNLTNIDQSPNTSNCTNLSQMYEQCFQLTTAPDCNTAKATAISGMFTGCPKITSLPAYNLANVTGAATIIASGAGFATATPLVRANITNARTSMTFINCALDKTELENVMTNAGSTTTINQTFTITGNPGADTALSKTSTWTNSSNVVTMANTVGVTVGCQLTGNQMANALAVTVNSNNTVSLASYIDNDTFIAFANVQTTNLAANTRYWVSNRAESSGTYYYNLSTSSGGNTITFTSGTANMLVNRIVTTVNTNSNVIISAWPSGNGTNATATTRVLNTNIITFKGFTVAG